MKSGLAEVEISVEAPSASLDEGGMMQSEEAVS